MWQRFEERKLKGYRGYAVTLHAQPNRTRTVVYLGVNNTIKHQMMRERPYLDVFIDHAGQRIGLRFLATPTDLQSYKPCIRNNASQARFSMTRLAKRLGILEALQERNFTAELKADPAANLYWFSIAALLKVAKQPKGQSPKAP